MSKNELIEITFDDVILDYFLYERNTDIKHTDSRDFEKGDYIIYLKGNNTWRAEVIKKVAGGYIVSDY